MTGKGFVFMAPRLRPVCGTGIVAGAASVEELREGIFRTMLSVAVRTVNGDL